MFFGVTLMSIIEIGVRARLTYLKPYANFDWFDKVFK